MAKSPEQKPGGVPSLTPEALRRLRGELDAAREAGMDVGDWRLKQQMEAAGLAWTSENFIDWKWRGELPDEWDEGEIPEDLQDWEKGGP
ncbi:MAG: hypothetical protein E5V62_03250 [Mesorhizobium sp.]|uniref:hypothetical protein n=1 Tax=Mesorhizobium sp. TaxID=1871066 RepID=UPI000FD5F703|nr:hypothetical protein [Mesorhizobium sp.]RVD67314.1 hypothetical protein EN751_37460 [Mesorhizobium sp. M4A.F.Ca.ET.029.04.2.1]TIW37178.1 MAG: hypothetical protein E5V62_03250 [Mesorhizobium sp.]